MNAIWQFLRDNAVWVVPIGIAVLTALVWPIRRLLEPKSIQQTQTVSNGSTGIQAARDVRSDGSGEH